MYHCELKELDGKACVLYGAGKYGRITLDNIKKSGVDINILCFIDDDLIRNNKAVNGYDVMDLKAAIKKYNSEFNIIIANYFITPVMQKVELAGFEMDKVFYIPELLVENIDANIVKEHEESMKKVFAMLEDYESKMIYRTAVEARTTGKIDALAHTCRIKQYFPNEQWFKLKTDEVFVDGGGYTGDTIEDFLNETKGQYKYIYSFEPDTSNYKKLGENVTGDNVLLFNGGLYESDGYIGFNGNAGGSSMVDIQSAEEKIRVYAIDELDLPDKDISFVKMDIEGSELSALKGMKKIIEQRKPKLAICIYHKFEDLWEIPLYIKQLVPEYKLYIRNYTTFLGEIVLYAVL